MNLSQHFTLAEFTRSATAEAKGIDNTPPVELIANLTRLALTLEKVRALCGGPLRINSGYRSPELNAAVGGARDSYHCDGCAADFDPPPSLTHDQLQHLIADADPPIAFDLLMEEGTVKPEALGGSRWLHLQVARGAAPRRLVRDAVVSRLGGKIERTTAG